MNKIIKGAKEALKIAKCEHDLTKVYNASMIVEPPLDKFICAKCGGTFYVPAQRRA